MLEDLLLSGDIDRVLAVLLQHVRGTERDHWRQEITTLASTWSEAQKQYRLNHISFSEYQMSRSKIVEALVNQYISKLPESSEAGDGYGSAISVNKQKWHPLWNILFGTSVICVLALVGYWYQFSKQDQGADGIRQHADTLHSPPREREPGTTQSKRPLATVLPRSKQNQEQYINPDEKASVGVAVMRDRKYDAVLANGIADLLRKRPVSASGKLFRNNFYANFFDQILDGEYNLITSTQADKYARHVLLVRQHSLRHLQEPASSLPPLMRESTLNAQSSVEATFDVLILNTKTGKEVALEHPALQGKDEKTLHQSLLLWIEQQDWSFF